MAAAKTGSAHVVAGDIDPVAVEVAAANLAANGLSGRVACIEAAGFGHPAFDAATPFDLVFANILKGPLLDLAGRWRRGRRRRAM
jgi:ribosomal protein L11 methyltransferase